MMALKQQANLAKNRAQELMDFNNAASSNKSDKLLSILEAGEGSSIARDQVDQWLHNHLTDTITDHNRRTALNYDRTKLRQCLSIKEKIAYVTGLIYADEGAQSLSTPLNSPSNIIDKRIRNTLDEIITKLEKGLLNNEDFSESRILRNAAINRFQCELSVSESNELNQIGVKVREVCANNGLDTLAESSHFTNESDAQKIMKLSDIIRQMSASNVNISDNVFKGFEKFDKKIEPLRTLDKHYEHVTKTLNMMHRVAQKGYHSAVSEKQQKKLNEALGKIDMMKTVNDALIQYNTVDNFSKNDEHGFLDNLLAQVKTSPKYKETIYSMSISDAEFNERFMSSSVFVLMERAKVGLHTQKGVAFGAKMKDFETDTQSRRGMVKKRVFEIADRMGDGADFGSNQDFETANSYFNKFKDLFFAKEEDNYKNGPNRDGQLHYHKMEKVVSALVRRRVPALASSHRIRRGSAGRIVSKFIEHAIKGKDRGIYQRIRKVRHNADDATVVAIVIMLQNEATNEVFYQDQDKTKKADNIRGKLWNKIRFVENGRAAIRDRMAPTVNKALTFTEESVKKGLQLTAGVAKVGNKILSKGARGLTRGVGGLTGRFNAMIKKGGYKRRKTPLYLPYVLSAGIEPLAHLGNKGATYTDTNGSAGIDAIKKTTGEGYDEAKKLVGSATGEETDYLFKGLTYATEKTTSLAGSAVSGAGQRVYDSYKTGQKRGILGAFYGAAKEQKGLEDLMQSSELGEMLNLKERGPYLFDKDGRIVITQTVEKKDENSPETISKEMSKNMTKQLSTLIKQADENIQKKVKEMERIDSIEDDKKRARKMERIEKEINGGNEQKTIIKDISNEINKIVPILEKPFDSTGKWKNTNIENGIKDIHEKLKNSGTPPPLGYLKDTEKLVSTAKIDLSAAQTAKKNKENDIAKEKINLRTWEAKTKYGSTLEKNAAHDEVKKAQDKILELEGKLINEQIKIENATIDIRNNTSFLSRLQKIYNEFENLKTINTDIGNNIPTTEQIKKIKNINSNLDLLLYPVEENTKKLNLSDISDEAKNALLEERKKTA